MPVGKVIAGLIGWFSFGIPGAIIGLFVGHFFDKGRATLNGRFDPDQRLLTQEAFFKAIFPVLGHLAKSDGRVSEEEVKGTEQLMVRMGLDQRAKTEAIRLFKLGSEGDFDLDSVTSDFMSVCGRYADLKQIYLVYLITLAYADGHLHENEDALLRSIAEKLGYSSFAFNHLMGMVNAQAQFRQRHGQGSSGSYSNEGQSSASELALAYEVLGVNASDGDANIKKAYRKLMSEFHPDKLAGRGVPTDVIKTATARSQEIQSAYDLIKKNRKK